MEDFHTILFRLLRGLFKISYDIIKKIEFVDNKVYLTSASNNVIPHNFERFEWTYGTNILQEKGREAVDIEILSLYDSGEFQKGSNKYIRALKVLYYFYADEYAKFDWRNNWESSKINHHTPEYFALLKKALNTPLPKPRYILANDYSYSTTTFFGKVSSRHVKWTPDSQTATKYSFIKEAINVKNRFMVRDLIKIYDIVNNESAIADGIVNEIDLHTISKNEVINEVKK